ncbi:MAG: RDD family protein [Vicinamibacteria bacterium]
MMQCPACSAPLASGEARCLACRALVNPPTDGAGALAPRFVTPQRMEDVTPRSMEGPTGSSADSTALGWDNPQPSSRRIAEAKPADARGSADEAWRREVLERVRKRRQVRTHALPLFVEGQTPVPELEPEAETAVPGDSAPGNSANEAPQAPVAARVLSDQILEELDSLAGENSSVAPPPPDLLASLDVPLNPSPDDPFDLQLRPSESAAISNSRVEIPSQSLVERARPTLVGGQGTRSLVADLPLVAPSRIDPLPSELPNRSAALVSSRAASINDRLQAAFIDIGVWSAMTATTFYFASRIARTSIMGLGPAWQGLVLFASVLAAAYVLFFGGLSGATPGKIACGLQVKRYDGTSLGPLASLARGFLGVFGVVLFGIGIWPAFWDKDRRTLHDRATGSRVTTV